MWPAHLHDLRSWERDFKCSGSAFLELNNAVSFWWEQFTLKLIMVVFVCCKGLKLMPPFAVEQKAERSFWQLLDCLGGPLSISFCFKR